MRRRQAAQKLTSITSWPTVDETVLNLLSAPESAKLKQLETAFKSIADTTFHNILQSGVDENAGEGLLDKLRSAAGEIRTKVDEAFRKGVSASDAKPFDVEKARTIVNAMLDERLSDDAMQKALADADLKRGISQV